MDLNHQPKLCAEVGLQQQRSTVEQDNVLIFCLRERGVKVGGRRMYAFLKGDWHQPEISCC